MRELVPDHEAHWFDIYGRVATTGEPVRFENEAKALGRWFDVYATRLGGAGSDKVAVLFNDITERRRSEENLRRLAAELAETDRRKTEFLATLAHELRNPLAPISNGLQLMRVATDDPQAREKARDMMERQLRHLVRLVDDLLDIARISSGKVELRKERGRAERAAQRGRIQHAAGQGGRAHAGSPHARRRPAGRRRQHAPRAGREQPPEQRRQVHARGRPHRADRAREGDQVA